MNSMTTYNLLKNALIKQRASVTASPKAAAKFLQRIGLDEIMNVSTQTPTKKATSTKK